jgi:hypothetical protein
MLAMMSGKTPFEMASMMAKSKGDVDLQACLAVPMGDCAMPPRSYDGDETKAARKMANQMFEMMSTHFNDKAGL